MTATLNQRMGDKLFMVSYVTNSAQCVFVNDEDDEEKQIGALVSISSQSWRWSANDSDFEIDTVYYNRTIIKTKYCFENELKEMLHSGKQLISISEVPDCIRLDIIKLMKEQ